MWEFRVLVFAPGHSRAGVRANISFKGSAMAVEGRKFFLTVDCRNVRLKAGGYDGRQWVLAWPGEAGEIVAVLQGETELRLMQQYAPPALAAQLKQATRISRRQRGRSRHLALALGLLLILALLLAGLLWSNPGGVADWLGGHVGLDTGRRSDESLGPAARRHETALGDASGLSRPRPAANGGYHSSLGQEWSL